MSTEQLLAVAIFAVTYAIALSRRVKIGYVSVAAAVVLLLTGILVPRQVFLEAIRWDVLGIYWGFMMIAIAFTESRVPRLLAWQLLRVAHTETQVLLSLAVMTAMLSAWMENVGVVLMMAPIAIEISRRVEASMVRYIVVIAISSNVVTTVTMVADPPPIILALETGMKFTDFYWFLGRPGLGTITVCGVIAALFTLYAQFYHLNRRLTLPVEAEKISVTYGASILLVLSVAALAFGHQYGLSPGIVGGGAGLAALWISRHRVREIFIEFDWNSFVFIVGIFVVVYALRTTGVLSQFASLLHNQGVETPSAALAWLVWTSVLVSSFMDNVPYTLAMIPVCQELARLIDGSAWPLLYGMLIGTGSGGNITPVGAAANIFAIGILEKQGYRVPLGTYMKVSIPFTVAAVATGHLLLWLLWL